MEITSAYFIDIFIKYDYYETKEDRFELVIKRLKRSVFKH